MARECLREQLCEGLVRFAALRVVDEQGLEGRELGRRRIDWQRDSLCGHGNRALVRRRGHQAREPHGVECRRRIVLHERVGFWCVGLRLARGCGQREAGLLPRALCLPHDGAARRGVCRDDLAREFYRAARGSCRDEAPEAERQKRARAELEEGSSGHLLHNFLLSISLLLLYFISPAIRLTLSIFLRFWQDFFEISRNLSIVMILVILSQ